MTVKMIAAEPMNGTDATLWDIERDPTLRTTVVSILQLDRSVKPERLLRSIDESSRLMTRMRQRVVEAPMGVGAPHWVIAEDVDVRDHVHFAHLEPPVPFSAVLELAAACAVEPFDRERPLWECTYVEGLDEGKAALIIKVHHSFTDGVGGVGLLDAFLDASRRPKRRTPDQLPDLRAAPSSGTAAPSLTDIAAKSASAQLKVAKTAIAAALHPAKTLTKSLAAGRSAARLIAPTGAALSPLFAERGLERVQRRQDRTRGRGHGGVTLRRGWRGLVLGQSVNVVIQHQHDHVGVVARGMDPMTGADRGAVAVAHGHEHVQFGPGQLDAGGDRQGSAMDSVEAVSVHVVRKTA